MVAMATTLFTVYCKLFRMMPYIIILKVRKFHQPTASRLSTARNKPVGEGGALHDVISLNRVKAFNIPLANVLEVTGLCGLTYEINNCVAFCLSEIVLSIYSFRSTNGQILASWSF